MAQKTCPSCGGSGLLSYDIERPQTCISCSGRGTITVPDPIPNNNRQKTASSGSSIFATNTTTKQKQKKSSHTDDGVWRLFKSTPTVKKKLANKKTTPAKAKSTRAVPTKQASDKIKGVASIIGIIGGFIILGESSNIWAALVGGVVIYLLAGATIVIVNNILDFTIDLIKTVAVITLWGGIILAAMYMLGSK